MAQMKRAKLRSGPAALRPEPFVTLPYALERAPPPFESHDVKYPEALVRYFLARYTAAGARVLDPFAGFGTTLFVAEEMGRIPYGIESDARRQQWVAGQLRHFTNLAGGDALRLADRRLPRMDFCITSPPYMARDHSWNPLRGGDARHAGYATYLRDVTRAFAAIARVMKRGRRVVVVADNVATRTFTPLVRDLSLAVGHVLQLEGETVVAWTGAPADRRHTQCLIFRA